MHAHCWWSTTTTGGGGRELASDNTEFLRIRLPVSLIPDKRHHDRDDHDED